VRHAHNFFLTVLLTCLAGCASQRDVAWNSRTILPTNAVRRLDYHEAPQAKELAARAQQLANEYYPSVVALLAEDGTTVPRQFDIIFKPHLNPGTPGVTVLLKRTIYLDTSFWSDPGNYFDPATDSASAFNDAFVHEMAHVTQRPFVNAESLGDIARMLRLTSTRVKAYWLEGVADHACFKLGFTTESLFCPKCSGNSPNYYAGYNCAGAFLLYLDSVYGSEIVRQLNACLRRQSDPAAFFKQYTGKPLAELWSDFQKTSAFTPSAARANDLQQTLGFVNGVPPRDFPKRFDAFLRRAPHGTETKGWLRGWPEAGGTAGNPTLAISMYAYLSQPGGSALSLLSRLRERYMLPGASRGDNGFWNRSFLNDSAPTFPATNTLYFTRTNKTICHYIVTRESAATRWKLQRAWTTDNLGKPLHEYSISEIDYQKVLATNLVAARVAKLQKALGYTDDDPPDDLRRSLSSLCRSPALEKIPSPLAPSLRKSRPGDHRR
jgi:Peptidase of plants and bacteria